VKRDPAAGLFPPPTALFSSAVWYTLDHLAGVVTLGLCGSAPFALLLVLFLRESYETVLVPGATTALGPSAFGLAAVYFVRFPLRLALAHWMAAERSGGRASLLRALAFAFRQLPTALCYGALSTIGWLLGSVVVVPFLLTLRASLAFHVFAGGAQNAGESWRSAGQVPVAAVGWRLSMVASVVYLTLAFVLWSTPGAALGLGEWLLKLNVTALRAVFAPSSVAWLLCALSLAWMAVELLWSVAFGLLVEEWERLSQGSDLNAELDALETRDEVFA
jgi:hypothetical protein